ncbi:hypothetical protein OAR42_04170 [Planktomarina temperata]|nr:hypothetical protein [Planktomarina temperata]
MSNRKTIKQRFRAFKTSIRQRLFKGLEWAQFYIYDPSKPSKAEFLKLSVEDQQSWIEANIYEYAVKLYSDNYLGCSYDLDEDKLDEYLEYRDDYGVSGLIEEQLPGLSEERAFEIDDGAELTSEELEALRTAMAENDFDGWDTHSGFYFKVRFGALYALFAGQDMGQGGSEFELEQVFKSRRLAVEYVAKKPMAALEVG